jgi:translation initiation factor eIF-2B subunit gamma
MEFEAFIFAAGRGSRLRDLTSDVVRPLLPVGNKPLIWYPLNTLEKAGFKSVTVCILSSTAASIENALKEYDFGLNISFYHVQDDDDWGTSNTLKDACKNVTCDILVLSCDIITDLPLETLADIHRRNDALVTMCFYPQPPKSELKPPGGLKDTDFDFVVLDHNTNEVVYMSAEADVEGEIALTKSLLEQHPLVDFYTKLIDSHIYFIKKDALSILATSCADFTSIRSEFIPKLVELRQTETVTKKYAKLNNSRNEDQLDEETESQHVNKRRSCYAIVARNNYCLRVNTVPSYYLANMEILSKANFVATVADFVQVHGSATVSSKAHIANDSFIGLSAKVEDKVSVKHSMIGPHCIIGERAAITNSIILANVKVGNGCQINGSVVSVNTELDDKVELKGCVVGSGHHLLSGTKYTNEVLIDPDRMMTM